MAVSVCGVARSGLLSKLLAANLQTSFLFQAELGNFI